MKKPPRIDAVIFDLDGTAVYGSLTTLPSNRIIAAVGEAQNTIYVAAATGRPYWMAKPVLSALSLNEPCVINGGSELINPKTDEVIWAEYLNNEMIREVLGVLKRFPYRVRLDALGDSRPDDIDVRDMVPRPNTGKIVVIDSTSDDRNAIGNALAIISGLAIHSMPSYQKGRVDIHITHELATKKHAMQALLAHANLNHAHVMVVGDGSNDLPLFELAGWKVAMGNAAPELKKAADWIAPSVDEDGLAVAIEKFVLRSG